MLRAYSGQSGSFQPIAGTPDAEALKAADWIDVHDPAPDELELLRSALGVQLRRYEESSYQIPSDVRAGDHTLTMTALLLARGDTNRPGLIRVTFVRTPGPLITASWGEGGGLGWMVDAVGKVFMQRIGPDDEFAAILDMIVNHAGDALEQVGGDLDRINRAIFQHRATPGRRFRLASPRLRTRQLERQLEELGSTREVLVKLRRSVLSLRRLVGVLREREDSEGLKAKLDSFENELRALADAELDLSNTANFVLDGAVGFITIQQSKIINILTVVGVVLTPPVVIASIYGMNFKHMPELDWQWGYAWAIGLMVVATGGMFAALRWRGWL